MTAPLLVQANPKQMGGRTLGDVDERGPDKVLDTGSLGGVGDGLSLGELRCGVQLLEEVGDGEDAIGALEVWSKGLGGVQVGLLC